MKPITFEKVSLAEAKRVHDGTAQRTSRHDWSSRRAANDQDEPLREATVAWMAGLPDGVRPKHLAQRFPRIANKICAMWKHPVRCSTYIAGLLIVGRVRREGFPMPVAKEIGKLTVHYATLHPVDELVTDPWIDVR